MAHRPPAIVLPLVVSPILVETALTLAQTIFTVTALSFLGMGVPPPDPNWGWHAVGGPAHGLAPLTVVGPAGAIVFATPPSWCWPTACATGSTWRAADGRASALLPRSALRARASAMARRHAPWCTASGSTSAPARPVGFVGESGSGKSVSAGADGPGARGLHGGAVGRHPRCAGRSFWAGRSFAAMARHPRTAHRDGVPGSDEPR